MEELMMIFVYFWGVVFWWIHFIPRVVWRWLWRGVVLVLITAGLAVIFILSLPLALPYFALTASECGFGERMKQYIEDYVCKLRCWNDNTNSKIVYWFNNRGIRPIPLVFLGWVMLYADFRLMTNDLIGGYDRWLSTAEVLGQFTDGAYGWIFWLGQQFNLLVSCLMYIFDTPVINFFKEASGRSWRYAFYETMYSDGIFWGMGLAVPCLIFLVLAYIYRINWRYRYDVDESNVHDGIAAVILGITAGVTGFTLHDD